VERPDQAVRRLIQELDQYAAATGEDVTVVFDRQPPDVPAGAHGAILVAFASRRGRDAADDEIVRMLAEDRAPHSFKVVFTGTPADLAAHGTTLTATTCAPTCEG
jgi:predicted RNA-binding protein with PIN domain